MRALLIVLVSLVQAHSAYGQNQDPEQRQNLENKVLQQCQKEANVWGSFPASSLSASARDLARGSVREFLSIEKKYLIEGRQQMLTELANPNLTPNYRALYSLVLCNWNTLLGIDTPSTSKQANVAGGASTTVPQVVAPSPAAAPKAQSTPSAAQPQISDAARIAANNTLINEIKAFQSRYPLKAEWKEAERKQYAVFRYSNLLEMLDKSQGKMDRRDFDTHRSAVAGYLTEAIAACPTCKAEYPKDLDIDVLKQVNEALAVAPNAQPNSPALDPNGSSKEQGPLGLRNMPADGVNRGPETGVVYFTGGTVRTDGFVCDAAFCNGHWLRVILYADDPYGSRQSNVTVNSSEKSFDFNQPIAGGTALRAEITEQDPENHYNCVIESTEPRVPNDDDARSPSLPTRVVNIRCTMTSTGRAAVDEAHRLKKIRDAQITN